jgi:ribosomal protein S18 acetylase RimI-like enzyme
MAAWPDFREARVADLHVVDLHQVAAADLAPLLDEEVAAWRGTLDWDMRAAASAVRRHIDTKSLSGFALLEETQPIGFCYYIRDGRKGLIGDLYVRAARRTLENENALLAAALEALWRSPGVDRVEAQLLLFGASRTSAQRRMPFPEWLHVYPRQYLEISASAASRLAAREPLDVTITPWTEARQDDSARLVAAAYRGHIDSDINDQYRSPAGARRFLSNIVQYPGCGTFFAPASYMAIRERTLCGISLASLVAERTGHITQICVAPPHRGHGAGYALLRSSLLALVEHGCDRISLTVTAANQDAIRLYRQVGFTLRREFAACVWNS